MRVWEVDEPEAGDPTYVGKYLGENCALVNIAI